MPSGYYNSTGLLYKQGYQKGHKLGFTGKHHTEKSKKKMRKRKVPWVKVVCEECGKIFEVCPSRAKDRFCSSSCSNKWQYKHNPKVGFQKGHPDIVSSESRKRAGKKISIALTGRKLSDEHKKNVGKTSKGRKYPNRKSLSPNFIKKWVKSRKKNGWFKNPEMTKKKMRETKINNLNRTFKDTSIEIKIEEELKKQEINYEKQVPLCNIAIVDFYLPEYKIIIQCDGCFWHGCPIHNPTWTKNKEREKNQDKVLKENGFIVYRFWEHEINENAEKCIKKLGNVK